ncbi:hypothetical protein DPMN_102772 [Dreissena polymorpha]|uniref:Uncharacterized protein n=1 Tax=Dreissena polymorpha TaxID=45954 RepID=A0A9D4R9E1_DREPO|nr:hypothetical protein DPMN_102772 [Dreissena polymorpha]
MPRKRKRGSLTVKRKYHYITSEQPKEENHVACEPLVNIKATTDSSTQSESENVQFTSDHSYAIDEDSTYELDSFQETNNDKPEADVMECCSGLLEMVVETTTFSDFAVELKLQNISSQFVVKESEQSIQMLQLYANVLGTTDVFYLMCPNFILMYVILALKKSFNNYIFHL